MKINVRELALRQLKFFKDPVFGEGVASRLPEEYRKFYREWREGTPEPVHYIPEPGKWKRDPDTGVVTAVQNVPLLERRSKEYENVFAGGELIIQGNIKRHPRKRRVPRFWVPNIKRSVIYSEILDKYMSVLVTERLLEKIHEHKGLDHYILGTKACDLNTLISVKLKRRLLFALKDKTFPYDEQKNEEIYEKYKKYKIPDKEVEWYGLHVYEAGAKQEKLEEEARLASYAPLKHKYRQELLEALREGLLEEQEESPSDGDGKKSWLPKIKNPFSSKTT